MKISKARRYIGAIYRFKMMDYVDVVELLERTGWSDDADWLKYDK